MEWEGQYEIAVTNGKNRCYLNLIDARQIKKARKEASITAAFNGFLKINDQDHLVIIDRNGCEWVYKRMTN